VPASPTSTSSRSPSTRHGASRPVCRRSAQ
jgi:hypothetical protein